MKRFLILLFVICYLLFGFVSFVSAQDRYATCDLCGYCPPNPPPSSWESCRQCLYESASPDPTSYDTLKIDELTNMPPTPAPGRWHTFIGCFNTNLGSFQQEGAAGSVVQTMLNLIFSVAGGIALIYFLYGSFIILTSQADPEKLAQGRRILSGAIIGLVFSLSSVFIINLLASNILKIPGFSSGP